MAVQKSVVIQTGRVSQIADANVLAVGAGIDAQGAVAQPLSSAGTGKIYFDSTSNTFRVSQNGGAYQDLGVGGGGGVVVLTGNFVGALNSPLASTARWYPPSTVTVKRAWASIGVSSTGLTEFDVLRNGSSILPSLVSISSGQFRSLDVVVSPGAAVTITDYLTISLITANGGSDAVVFVEYE